MGVVCIAVRTYEHVHMHCASNRTTKTVESSPLIMQRKRQLDDASSSESGASSSDNDRRRDSEGNKRRKPGDCRRLWHPEWETTYLVLYDSKKDTCRCLKCNSRIDTVKKYNLQRHCENMHPDTKEWSDEKRKQFVQQAKQKLKQMQQCLSQTFVSSTLPQLASYKLGFTLVKHHKPLAFGEAITEWAISSDPESKVFQTMPKSRQTLTRRVSEMVDFIQTGNLAMIRSSPCWGIQMDESTDKSDFAQAIIYSRYADMESCCITTRFLTILRVEGSPNADDLYETLNQFIETRNLPK